MHRSHFADRVRAFLLAAALVSALICPQALAADAAGSGGCAQRAWPGFMKCRASSYP